MLEAKGINVTPEGNRLKIEPADKLTPELLDLIKQHKQAIIEALTQPQQQEPTQQPQQTEQPQHKPFKNLSLARLTALIGKDIPEGKFIVVDFDGVRVAVCRKENERELQERGLTTLTPKELARYT